MPPVSFVASSSAGISVSHSVSGSANMTVTSSGRTRRDSSHSRASRSSSVCGEQLVEEQDLDAAVAHQVDERVELLARAPHPDHVVEQQLVAVGRREPLVREVGPVDHHRSELSPPGGGAQGAVGWGVVVLSSPPLEWPVGGGPRGAPADGGAPPREQGGAGRRR